MWPFKKKSPEKEKYPVYLRSHNDRHYIIVYSDNEGYYFSLKSQSHGKLVHNSLLSQYTSLYEVINEHLFIDALDECDYISRKEKLYILVRNRYSKE